MLKDFTLSLELEPTENRVVQTAAIFWSHDVNTAKIYIELLRKGTPIILNKNVTVRVMMLFDDENKSEHIYTAKIEDELKGLVSITLEESMRMYVGQVICGVYVDYQNEEKTDNGYFTFGMRRSLIDKDMPELQTLYVPDFEKALEKFKEIEDKIERNDLVTKTELKAYSYDKNYVDSNFKSTRSELEYLRLNKADKSYVDSKTDNKAEKNDVDKLSREIQGKLDEKRNKSEKIKRVDMDTSTDSNRLGLQNLSQEVHNALAGNANVNPDIPNKSITSEKIADGAVKQINIDKNIRTKKLTIDDFGAKADGNTDNYNAIMSAIEALDEVIIPPCPPGKKYLLNKTIVVPSNKKIRGYGNDSFIQLSNNNDLTAHKWRDGMPDFYPLFVTESNAQNVHFENFRVEGASQDSKEQIQVGIAIYESKKCSIKGVNASRINYFPSQAPPRPSGQFRRGWNALTIRSEDVEISYSHFEKGAYECFRIGDYCKRINFHHNTVGNGWRTCVQALRGSEDITIADNYIKQDDFDKFDSHAALTFHSSEGNTMRNIRIERNIIDAKVFTDNPNGGSAISFVDTYHEDYIFKDNIIISNGYGMLVSARGSITLVGNEIKSVENCMGVNSLGITNINLERNKFESEKKSCITVNNSSEAPLKRGSVFNNEFKCDNQTSNGILFGGNSEISGFVFNNNHVLKADKFVTLAPNVSQSLIINNDLRGTKVVDLGQGNIIKDNIGYTHENKESV